MVLTHLTGSRYAFHFSLNLLHWLPLTTNQRHSVEVTSWWWQPNEEGREKCDRNFTFLLTSYFFVLLWLVSEKWPRSGIPVHKFHQFSISLTGHYTKRQKINRGQSRERKLIRYAVELMFLHISWCQKNGNYVRDNFHFLALHEMWENTATFLFNFLYFLFYWSNLS